MLCRHRQMRTRTCCWHVETRNPLQSQMWTQWELEPRHRQQATIEATDTGERARGWFLRHFRVCRCFHHNKPPRAQPRCQEVQGARALLLAEGGIPCKTLQDLKPIGCLTFETYCSQPRQNGNTWPSDIEVPNSNPTPKHAVEAFRCILNAFWVLADLSKHRARGKINRI